ncbi:putative ATP-dependent endonuclease of OLD family [Streptomyces sp. Ag109_G2-6]|uniref:ATP-dependent nuclease n=1 Tax=Streptomyces TaxID=1883 RepID=UPI0009A4C5B8|nr:MULTISPECIES: AAA family ATPase [Streptomyces]RPF44753.1 putative ATP-dependent endonuclease of OLD family [Streptomyces sp. Ag109_G2-6]
MHLNSFGVSGFRSLTEITDIPVGKPTILAGHNDGGKSAVLGALAFLLGKHELTLDDRTYMDVAGGDESTPPLRCTETSVVGRFTLDTWEQNEFGLPERVRLRRCAGEDLVSRLELWEAVPDDERLHDLAQYQASDAKALVKELGLSPLSARKPDLLGALRAYGREHASSEGWVLAPSGLGKRMPRYLPFDGKAAKPDDAVRTALIDRFSSHMADPELKGRLSAIEGEVQDRLRLDAKSLCDHIQTRCPDLQKVSVDPDVSFQQGFKGAPLRIARRAGEAVGLDRTGLGSNRRISLAIWEWTQELLAAEEDTAPTVGPGGGEPLEPPTVQTIVVYDEPDTHLDYTHQRKIMQLIRAQSDVRDVNVVVATHSMNLIDGVDISDVVHLKLVNHRTVVERLGAGVLGEEIDEYLGKIAAAVGLRNSVLLHERCFLAVEGETEQQAFPLLFRLCEGLSLQAAGIALWACFNNEGALHLARYLVRQGRTVMLVVDADSRNVSKSIFKTPKLTQFFGTDASRYVKFLGEPEDHDPQGEMFNELEELFHDGVWARVANKIWPKDDGTWQPADFAALRSQGKFSSEVQQMLQSGSASGPGGKPRMMSDLAMTLNDPQDVPMQLRNVFKELRKVAS